jgi:hypothetical protein
LDEQRRNAQIISLFWQALCDLAGTDKRWFKNRNTFSDWSDDQRLIWIAYIERQAKRGLPLAEAVMTEVVKIRMAG